MSASHEHPGVPLLVALLGHYLNTEIVDIDNKTRQREKYCQQLHNSTKAVCAYVP